MIQYGKQNISQKDIAQVVSVLRSDFLTQGPAVREFEEVLAAYCNVKYAVAVNSGTAALHLAYLAAGIQKGDEVITTPNTFVATTNMLLAVGAVPVFCDIRLDTNNIDESAIEALVTKKTKAIVTVDFAGHPCEYAVIRKIAKRHKLVLIADACHALGASYKNKKVGSLADITVFSFHPVKSITTGEGGALLTNKKQYYEKALSLRSHGIHKDANGKNVMIELGYNYRIPDILAALGSTQLERLDVFIARRCTVASWYEKQLRDIDEIILPVEKREVASSWHLYVIRTKQSADRQLLFKHLQKNGIGVNFHYPAVYRHPFYRAGKRYTQLSLSAMDEYNSSCITLPCHTLLTKKDVTYISEKIKEFYV